MVVSIPVAPRVERDEEEIRALEFGEQPMRIVCAEYRVARLGGEPVEYRCLQEKVSRLVVDRLEHLGCQIVGDVAVRGGELSDAVARLVDACEPERGETDACRPAFGSLDEDLDVVLSDGDTCTLDDELVCLRGGERDLPRAQLAESTPGPQSAEPPAWIRSGRDDHPRGRWKTLGGVAERTQAVLRTDAIEVVENDDHAT